jgi:cytochrome c553
MATKHVFAALVCAALTSISGSVFAAPGNVEAGQEKAVVCGGCHGVDGNVGPEIFAAIKAPKLAGQVPEYIVKSIHDFKSGKRVNESMSPQAQAVADVDVANIAAYFGAQHATPVASTNKELLAQGEKIFLKGKGRPDVVAACVGCHGLGGRGNHDWGKTMSRVPTVLAPAIGGQHAAYLLTQLAAYKAGTRATDEAKVMRDITHRLTEQEIAAVAEYVSTLKR